MKDDPLIATNAVIMALDDTLNVTHDRSTVISVYVTWIAKFGRHGNQ